jgi:hypothetical protein
MSRGTRKGVMRKFYFIRPRKNINAGELAEKLIELKPVEEVFLTEGDCGFIVKARFTNNKEPKDVVDYISKNVGSKYGKVVSYYEYRK